MTIITTSAIENNTVQPKTCYVTIDEKQNIYFIHFISVNAITIIETSTAGVDLISFKMTNLTVLLVSFFQY